MRSCHSLPVRRFQSVNGLRELSALLIGRSMMSFAGSLMVLGLVGCGGGEDFSKPPEGVASRLSKAAEQPKEKAAEESTAVANAAKVGTAVEAKPDEDVAQNNTDTKGATSDSPAGTVGESEKSDSADVKSNEAHKNHDNAKSPENTLASDSKPADAKPSESKTTVSHSGKAMPLEGLGAVDESSGTSASAAEPAKKSDEEETMTASGRTAKSLSDKKEENSKMTVAENAGGLLGSLKSSKAASAAKKENPTGDYDAPDVLTRFGRMAMSQPDWLRLVTRLSRRFYVATNSDSTRILASSGERSAGVVEISVLPPVRGRYGTADENEGELLQAVTSLQGQLTCVELTSDGQTALFGTVDGRVLVRTITGKRNWDVYARDLFLFQDEIRTVSRLSDNAIVVLRELSSGRFLSIDVKGAASIWNTSDIIAAVDDIQTLDVAEILKRSSSVRSPQAIATIPIEGLQILSVSESADGQWIAIVSSAETITIIHAESAEVVDTLNAAHFADTQPVSVAFLSGKNELLAGLADGRIFRRAFGKDAAPVSGVNDAGEPVDYDAVFIPDVKDRPDSITVIAPVPETNFVYVGSVSGTLARLDLTQKRMELLPTKLGGAVIVLNVSPYGTLGIGDERRGVLFDRPMSPITREIPGPRDLSLPTDETLKETNNSENQTPGARPIRKASPIQETAIDPEMIGVRPTSAELALIQHQLRTTGDEDRKEQYRKDLLRITGRSRNLPAALAEKKQIIEGDKEVISVPMLAEFTTDFLFTERAWQDVRLTCSDDGKTAVVSHISRPGVLLVDLPTGVILRRWIDLPNARQYFLNDRFGRIMPTLPVSAELSALSGLIHSDPHRPFLTCAVSPNRTLTVLGHFGRPGLAEKSITIIDDVPGKRTESLEMFESMVTALEFSANGESLYASFRSRDQSILQELDPVDLRVRATLIQEPLSGAISEDISNALDDQVGTLLIHSSEANRALLTFGTYSDGPQLRLWRRSSKSWPQENVLAFKDKQFVPDADVLQPLAFVNHQEAKIAVVTKDGLSLLNTKKGKLEQQIPIPSVGSRRPCVCFTPDEKWFIAGDADGNVHALLLTSPTRKPLRFEAHSGPVAGMCASDNGKFLLTAGEDNRLRLWDLEVFLN